MYKIIGADGKEYGPVSAEQLREWIAQGRANALTRVQPEGGAEWTTLGALPEFTNVTGTTSTPAPPAPPPSAGPSVEEITGRDYRLEIGKCIERGWELFKRHPGTLLGGVILIMVIQCVIALLPFVGGIAGLIIGGAMAGGLFWLFIRAIRAESGGVGDVFAGFSRGFVQLMLGHIVKGLLAWLAIIPGAIFLGIGIAVHVAARAHGHSLIGIPLLTLGALLLLAAIPIAIYLSTCWYFTLPLIIDKGMDFWAAMKFSRAMVRKHWWNVFGVMFVSGLVAIAGVLACGLGVFVTIPIALAAMMYAYEDIFGSGTPAA